jgi:hypothetical protein
MIMLEWTMKIMTTMIAKAMMLIMIINSLIGNDSPSES